MVVFLQSNDLTQVMVAAGEEGGWCHVVSPRLGWNQSLQASPFNQLIVSDRSAIIGSGREDKAVVVTTVGALSLYIGSEHSVYSPLPLSDLGQRYIISSCHIGTSIVLVIATSSDLIVDIVFKMSGTLTYGGRVYSNGEKLSLSLQKYQTFSLKSTSDITGTIVEATGPIAVFIGIVSSKIYSNRDVTTIATEQLVPVEHYGKEFVVPVFDSSATYLLHILGEYMNTVVTFNNETSLTINRIYEQRVGPRENVHFITDKPVMTTLCRNIERYSGFTALSPVTSYGKNVALYVGPYTLKISTKRSSSVTVWSSQSVRVSVTWENVTNTDYKVGTVTTAATFLTSTEDFSVVVFHADHVHRGGYTGPYTSELPDSREPTTPAFPMPNVTVTRNEDDSNGAAIAVGVSLAVIIVILVVVLVILLFFIKRKTKMENKSGTSAIDPQVMYHVEGETTPTPNDNSVQGRNSRYAGLGIRETVDHDYTAFTSVDIDGENDGRISSRIEGEDNRGYEDLVEMNLAHTDYTTLH